MTNKDFKNSNPRVWAEDLPPGLAINHNPIIIGLYPTATPVAIKQYPCLRKPILDFSPTLLTLNNLDF